MKERKLAGKYAKALVETFKDEGEYKSVKGELLLFLDILRKDKKLYAGMSTHLFSYKQKISILDLVKDKTGFSKKACNFLSIVIEENRISYLDTMADLMEEFWNKIRGIEKFKVFSVEALDDKLEKKLVDNLEKAFNKKVVLEKKIDRSLIAGIKIQRGSVYYDFSIEGNLKKLKESLISDLSV